MNPLPAIVHNLANLANFRGRQTRSQFWPYAIFVGVLLVVGTTTVFAPMMAQSMARLRVLAAENPESATIDRTSTSETISFRGAHPEILPEFNLILGAVAAGAVIFVLLLAAAVTRRLHDRGKSGAWGLVPPAFLLTGLTLMPLMFEQVVQTPPNMALFFALFINNALYLASLVMLTIWLVGGSAPGENRFGAAVVR